VPKLLTLGQTHRTLGRLAPRDRKILVLVVALVLSLGAFVFVGGEAWARQLHQEQPLHPEVIQHVEATRHVMIDGEEVTEPTAGTPPAERAPAEKPLENTPLVDSVPPFDQHELGPGFEPPPPDPGPSDRYELETPIDSASPAPGALDRYGTETPLESGPTPERNLGPEPVVPTPEPDPVSSVDPTPVPVLLDPALEQVTFEENEPLSSYAEEAPASEPALPHSGQEESHPLSSLGTLVNSAVETLESAANVLGNLPNGVPFRPATEEEGSIGATLMDLFSGGEAGLAPAVEGSAEDPGSPSGGTGSPSKDDTLQPSFPFAPPPVASGFFSLVGSEIGPGGVAPLLLCILVSVSILLRLESRISWAFCDFSKPSSALLSPLERPG
jgi:hypothetical protein